MKRLIMALLMLGIFITPINADEWSGNTDEISEPGTYYIEVSTQDENGQTVTTLVRTVVTTNKTVINNTEAIDAQAFQINSTILESVSDSDLISMAHARAWIVETNETVPITKVKLVKKSDTSYTLTFSTELGTSVTVDVVVILGNSPMEWNQVQYSPNTFESISNRVVELTVLALLAIPLVLIILTHIYISRNLANAEKLLFTKE